MADESMVRFETIVLPHLDGAYTLARYLLRDDHDAQDVVQESVLRALRHFEGYRDGDARAWLLSIVRNCALTWFKRNRGARAGLGLTDTAGQVAGPLATDALAERRSERERIERALHQLPVEFREVIVLREIQDLSYKEIGDVTGVPIGTVMSRLARARKRLAALLGDDAREVG